jgi:outer membrane assembly lipoprotein YfiO
MTLRPVAPIRSIARLGFTLGLIAALAACASQQLRLPAPGEQNADKFLFDRGTESLAAHHWLDAREYFRRLVDTFPQSSYRQDAKLGIGDSYLGENRIDSDILAANEFREFLTFFPLNARADYAQYKLALAQCRQMLAPQRDQTATHDALRELDAFVQNYPTSPLLPEVLKLQRDAKDRLSESEFRIGLQYFRAKFYPGAIPRFKGIVETDPMYTHRDEVYYYLAESYYLSKQPAEAIPYYDRIVEEFAVSEFLEKAKARLAELKP